MVGDNGNGLLKVTLRMDKVTPTISKIQTFPLKNGENTCKEIQSMIYDNDSTYFSGVVAVMGLLVLTYSTRNMSSCKPTI